MVPSLYSPLPHSAVDYEPTRGYPDKGERLYLDEQGNLTDEIQLSRSECLFDSHCLTLCEQDEARNFLDEGFALASQVFSPYQSTILLPTSSGLVKSLSIGSAGMAETQIALSNGESTHQTFRGPSHLHDYDQISDSSRGLLCLSTTSRMDSTLYDYNSIRLLQWISQSENMLRLGQDVLQARQPESTIAPSMETLEVPPLLLSNSISLFMFENDHNNEETTVFQIYDRISTPRYSLEIQNPPELMESRSDVDLQNEAEINIQLNCSTRDLMSWYSSFDDSLNSLAIADNSSYDSTISSSSTSSQDSPTAELSNITVKSCLVSPLKKLKHMHRASHESCHHCGATFSRPSELRRYISKHILPFKCSAQGYACAFAQCKDLKRHLRTRKHWHDETRPLPKVFCDVEGCKFAMDGFTRKDNLLRHMRRIIITWIRNMQSIREEWLIVDERCF